MTGTSSSMNFIGRREFLKTKFLTTESLKKMIEDEIKDKSEINQCQDFFIFFKSKLAGVFEFVPIPKDSNYIEIGYWLFEEFQRKRILSTVLPAMMDYIKNDLKKETVKAIVGTENIPSQRLLLALNFQPTSQTIDNSDESEDEIVYQFKLVR